MGIEKLVNDCSKEVDRKVNPKLTLLGNEVPESLQGIRVSYFAPEDYPDGKYYTDGRRGIVFLPPYEEYYKILTSRNRGVIGEEVQERLEKTEFIIFGCGSVGAPILLALAQLGGTNFFVVDGDKIEPSNLNRQPGDCFHIGMYKVDNLEECVLGVNPYINIVTDNRFITKEAVEEIFDDLKKKGRKDVFCIFAMDDAECFVTANERAHELGIPLILLLDIGHSVHSSFFDYSNVRTRLFNGRMSLKDSEISFLEIISKFVSIKDLPIEYLSSIKGLIENSGGGVPQVKTASEKAASIACEIILSHFEGKKQKGHSMHNTKNNQLTRRQKFLDRITSIARLYEIARLKKSLKGTKNRNSLN